jgi:hypothetical protein
MQEFLFFSLFAFKYGKKDQNGSIYVVNSKDWLHSATGPRKQPDQMSSGFHPQFTVSALSASGANFSYPWPRLPAQLPTAVWQPKPGT